MFQNRKNDVNHSSAEKAWRSSECLLLLCVLALASFLRLYQLGQSPPGMNVDEGTVAWNSYCLLKAGMDEHGVRWPVFDSESFGQGTTTLPLYLLAPFQAVFGFNVVSARILAASAGVLTVFLLYIVGSRMFDKWTGLFAAFLLAVNPWHLQISRWNHPASVIPLIVIAPLVLMLWANLPPNDDNSRRPRVMMAALAGAAAGIGCYGYYAARVWIPVFYLTAVLVTWGAWRMLMKTRRGAIAIGAMVFTAIATFGPLVWATIFSPLAGKRASLTWVWDPFDSLWVAVQKTLARYPGHFGPDFLFLRGDTDIALSPPQGYGLFHWYLLPMMFMGLAYLLLRIKSSRAARVLLAMVVLYPAADMLSRHPSLHALRSLPGVLALPLLAAVGAVSFTRWLWRRHRPTTVFAAVATSALMIVAGVQFLNNFYGAFNSEPAKFFVGHADILEATKWLKPRLEEKDAVFVTSSGIPHPYLYTLVGLEYDPHQWFLDPKEVIEGPLPDGSYDHENVVLRYGKMHFVFGDSFTPAYRQLMMNGKADQVVFIMRPDEFSAGSGILPSQRILDPQGHPSLLIYEVNL